MAPEKILSLLQLLVVLIIGTHTEKTKKIKIHVPYYIKHVHHYKKVYVPKVHVVKHEHLHKKEKHEIHHHHDHGHHHHDGYYDKADGGFQDDYDAYYDDIDHRSYNGNRLAKNRDKRPEKWRDSSSSSEEDLSSEEDEYINGSDDDEGILPAPLPPRFRRRPPVLTGPPFRRTIRRNGEPDPPTVSPTITHPPPKRTRREPAS